MLAWLWVASCRSWVVAYAYKDVQWGAYGWRGYWFIFIPVVLLALEAIVSVRLLKVPSGMMVTRPISWAKER